MLTKGLHWGVLLAQGGAGCPHIHNEQLAFQVHPHPFLGFSGLLIIQGQLDSKGDP